MRTLLKEHDIWAPFSGQSLMIDKSILELQEKKMHLLILLSMSDGILYEVFEELTIVGLWLKLEKLFMMKLICHNLLFEMMSIWSSYDGRYTTKGTF